MRPWLYTAALFGALCLPAWSQQVDIVDVLRRSQDARLEALPAADQEGEHARAVRASYEALLRALHPDRACELRIVRGPVIAETIHGHIIVANESIAEMPEGARLFVLAHELGHVVLQHWLATGLLYQKWIPGQVTADLTDPIAGGLGRDASVLAHQQEFAADEFAANALRSMGRPPSDWLSAFQSLGIVADTATHPGTRKRLAMLRQHELQ
jgi:hypothetical protein